MIEIPHRKYRVLVPVILAGVVLLVQIIPLLFSDKADLSGLSDRQFIEHLDQKIPELMEDYSVPGLSIVVVKDRHPLWSKPYGYADIADNRNMTGDAIYRVESLSKPVTAWGVMKLAERDLVNLDDPIQQYLRSWTLPESEYNADGMTIRRLLSNSAGMPLGTLGEEYEPSEDRPDLRNYLMKEAQLRNMPGSEFLYSNPGFNLLELLIEEVTGRDFNAYMTDEVLLPLEMQNSSFDWKSDWSSRIPTGYDLEGTPVPPYVYPYKASGGLFAPIKDIARFVTAEMSINADHPALGRPIIKDIQTPQIKTSGIYGLVADDYSFGHFIETLPDGKKALWHGGQGHGWMTHFHLVPQTGDGIIILTNSQRSWPMMGYLLKDWSVWRGFGPVKFSRITTAITILRIVISLIFLVAIWYGVIVACELAVGGRKVKFGSASITKRRITEFLLGIIMAAGLLWAGTRDYLFLTSIFPVQAIWLGWALALLAVVLLISVLLPVVQAIEPSTNERV